MKKLYILALKFETLLLSPMIIASTAVNIFKHLNHFLENRIETAKYHNNIFKSIRNVKCMYNLISSTNHYKTSPGCQK